MQLVLSNNRVIAHGENFLALGGVVINTVTGAKYENATVADCDGCPSDIDKVGYEYIGGVFKPCAPYGKGNNNGYFMEVCESCATPRNSGIPIKNGIKLENLHPEVTAIALGSLEISPLWENEDPRWEFEAQPLTLSSDDYTFLLVEVCGKTWNTNKTVDYSNTMSLIPLSGGLIGGMITKLDNPTDFIGNMWRFAKPNGNTLIIGDSFSDDSHIETGEDYCIPIKVYGIKL